MIQTFTSQILAKLIDMLDLEVRRQTYFYFMVTMCIVYVVCMCIVIRTNRNGVCGNINLTTYLSHHQLNI